jgi:flagellar motor switch protein FliM
MSNEPEKTEEPENEINNEVDGEFQEDEASSSLSASSAENSENENKPDRSDVSGSVKSVKAIPGQSEAQKVPEENNVAEQSEHYEEDLSQYDIDNLINKYAPSIPEKTPVLARVGEPEKDAFQISPTGRRFKKYDFRHPDKLAKDQIRKIKSRFEPLPRYLSNYFTRLLKRQVDVRMIEIDQKRYGDVFKPSPTPVIYGIFIIGPTYPTGIIELPIHLFYSILERMMGGSGKGKTQPRPLTDFENYLVTDIYTTVLQYYKDIFNKIVAIEPQIELVDTDGQIIPKTLPPEEVMVRKVYEIRIEETVGYLTISLPYNFIGNYFTKYGSQKTDGNSENESIANLFRSKTYKKMMVPLSVEFKKMRIRAADALNLAQGQIIYLDHHTEEDMRIKINGKLKYFGQAGMRGNKMAISLTSNIEEEV